MELSRRVTRLLAKEIDAERRDRQRANLCIEKELAKCQEDIQELRNQLAKLSPPPTDHVKKTCKCSYCHGAGHNRVTCTVRREHMGLSIL